MKNALAPLTIWTGSLSFVHGAFFEIMVSITTAMVVVDYWYELNEADHISIYCQLFAGVIVVLYVSFIFYFACC